MAFSTGFWVGGTEGTAANMNLCLMGYGLYSEFPAAAAGNKGALAYATDRQMCYYSDGAAWQPFGFMPPASAATGDIIYFDGTKWVRLAAGTANYLLKANGAAAPSWAALSIPATTQAVVTGSRAINGSVYQNTSGYTKVAIVTLLTGNTSVTGTFAYCDSGASPSTIVAGSGFTSSSAPVFTYAPLVFLIPPNYYYKVIGGTNTSLNVWTEYVLGV